VKTFANHTDHELRSALATAHALYQSDWCKGPRRARLQVLQKLAGLIEERAEELARIVVTEMGKRISEARWEVKITADIARYYANNAETFLAPQKLATDRGDAWVEYHPIGVVLAVEPWNFPYYQLIRVAAPSIAIGNPVLAKHASIVPRAAVAFEELVRAAGPPRCAWANIFASGEQIAWLIEDERVQAVALTGSEDQHAFIHCAGAAVRRNQALRLWPRALRVRNSGTGQPEDDPGRIR
jgi:succinate-semialdehyde dehydrogenase/glutarate-semialdehyde dehydrogenase